MCGIVGYIGDVDAVDVVIEGLKRLEYRGYDSAGVATVSHGELRTRRKKGKLRELSKLLGVDPIEGNLAIGHTRWATHGKPSDENAHPHIAGDLVLVHNGIIENYLELRQAMESDGVVFHSETDSEVLAQLISREKGTSLFDRVLSGLKAVRGAYAIAVISEESPDEIIVAKNASPLVLGTLDGASILASDIPALLPFTRDVIILQEGDCAILKADSIRVSRIDTGAPVERPIKRIEWSPVMAEKGGHKHFMHKEMHEQSRALSDTLRGRLGMDAEESALPPTLRDALKSVQRIIFTACGTSWHACLVGRLAVEELARLGCEVELASELRYRHPLFGPETLVIGVSQSGETADTLAALREAQAQGSPVCSIVNVLDSSIAREADWVLYTHAGPEIGVASTKAFITQVALLIRVAISIAHLRGAKPEDELAGLLDEMRQLPKLVEDTLAVEDAVIEAAHEIQHAKSALFLGRGYHFPVALEGALKLKEISYIHAEGYAAGEMKHGPIALVERGVPVISLTLDGRLYEKTVSNMVEVKARDATTLAIATEGNEGIKDVADHVLYVPKCSEILSSILATIPLQLLSYHVADARGTDIDQPRNLAKSVTVE